MHVLLRDIAFHSLLGVLALPVQAAGIALRGVHQEPAASSSPGPQPAEQELTRRAVDAASRALAAVASRTGPAWDGPLRAPPNPWPMLFEQSRGSMSLVERLLALESSAKRSAKDPLTRVRRPMTFDGIDPTQLDRDALKLQRNRDAYALARADVNQAAYLRQYGVELAVVVAWRKDPELLARALALLEAFADHRPLQRPGSTLSSDDMTMPPGGDGVWLATAWGVSGIVEMLDLLGDQVPAPLRARLELLLREEVMRICEDWADRRPWFVRVHTPVSNQWLEPSLALVQACLHLKDPGLARCYDLGVENIAQTLSALGGDGAFLEGFSYANQSVGPLFDAVRAVRANGDRRLDGFAYLDHAWEWFAHMNLGAGVLVHTYDSRMMIRPDWARSSPTPSEASVYLSSAAPGALQAARYLLPDADASVTGVRYAFALAGARGPSAMPLPTYASFPSQGQVVWRSAWEAPATASPKALAVVVRSGTVGENHVQRDNGQVTVMNGRRFVLTEAGTPDYGAAGYEDRFAGAAGHSVMQVGPVQPASQPRPCTMSVRSLDASGGAVSMDLTSASRLARTSTRGVTWTSAGRIVVEDAVSFGAPIDAGTEVYRFHVGSTDPVTINGSGRSWDVQWRGTTMALRADRPVRVAQQSWPDAIRAPFRHQVVTISVGAAGAGLKLDTTVQVDLAIVD
ncbi:MAG: heparinase II/III family protein [Planctomycetes bacterium]|nr:heparinase II/III family protein [Planctomycetota bacterium]